MGDSKKVTRPEKIAGSPYARLLEFATEHSLEQFRVVLRRRGADGTVRVLKSYQSLDPNEIDHMVDWVPSEFGGGRFEVEVTHPLDPQQRFLNWGFDVEGDSIEPRRNMQAQPGIDQQLQQHQSGGYMPPRPQMYGNTMQGSSPLTGMPIGAMPMPMQQPQYYQRPAPPPVRDVRLDAELDALKKQNEQLMRQIQEDRHAAEMRQLRDDSNRQLLEIKSGMEQQITILKQEVMQRRPDEGGSNMKELFSMMMKQAEMQQNSLNAILNRQSDDKRDQLSSMQKQMEQDLSFRKEMYEMAQKQKDPTQAAAMLDMMGNQTASMLNLVQQAVSSGLLGGQEGDPAWLRAVQQGLTGLQEFGQNILAAKQQEAAMGSLRMPPQPGAPRLPGQRVAQPGQRPGVPQQPQGAPQAQPRGTVADPGGRAPQRAPAAPQRGSGPTAVPGTQAAGLGRAPGTTVHEASPEEPSADDDGDNPQAPPSLLVPIQRFTQAIADKAPAEVVGDMIYTFVEFLRVNDMLPREWREVFDDPSETVGAFLQLFVPHIKPTKEYLDDIGQRILELEEEYGPDVPEGEPGPSPAKLRVIEAPTPPIPEPEVAATTPAPPEPTQPQAQE